MKEIIIDSHNRFSFYFFDIPIQKNILLSVISAHLSSWIKKENIFYKFDVENKKIQFLKAPFYFYELEYLSLEKFAQNQKLSNFVTIVLIKYVIKTRGYKN